MNKAANYFPKNVPLKMLDWVVNIPLMKSYVGILKAFITAFRSTVKWWKRFGSIYFFCFESKELKHTPFLYACCAS